LTQIYEGMFLLDNQVVRTDWKKAKAIIAETLTKHGGTVHTLRRWEEKRLAYPINKTNRATYYLAHYELPIDEISATLREFDLSESVMRYLVLAVDEVPEEERKLAALEDEPPTLGYREDLVHVGVRKSSGHASLLAVSCQHSAVRVCFLKDRIKA